jgi:hypothetical protein
MPILETTFVPSLLPMAKANIVSDVFNRSVRRAYALTNWGKRSQNTLRKHAGLVQKKRRTCKHKRTLSPILGKSFGVRSYQLCCDADGVWHFGQMAESVFARATMT